MTLVLLLEDNPDMQAMLSQVLEWGGYDVIKGYGGQQGVEILHSVAQLPDIILSDLSMPDMDGLEFLGRVRANPDWAGIPFVIMSAHSSSNEQRDALDHGANDFLVKPFSLADFQSVLDKWV